MSNPKSIRAQLYNIAKNQGIDFQVIATRYFHERLLYRLSLSSYDKTFILKGGNWIYAWQGMVSRPTTDIDFLGLNINNDDEYLINVFSKILSTEVDDGVNFRKESLKTLPIRENNPYQGIRLKVEVSLDTIRQSIQVDVGFGDKVIPNPVQMNYPLLLRENADLILWAYNAETVIAEKFHAMLSLGSINSRMKDIFDLYRIFEFTKISDKALKDAIKSTFATRHTDIDFSAVIFSSEHINNPRKEKQWRQFLKKIKSNLNIPFSTAVTEINIKIRKVMES